MGTYVRPEGDLLSAKLVIVGEQPGKTEVLTGRPFVGPAGIELNECLKAVGLIRTDCYITNFAKDFDRHVEEYLNLKTGVFSDKGLEHKHLLLKEMNSAKAPVILAVGHYAMTALTSITSPGIGKWRGSVLESPEIPRKFIIPTFHPATIIPPKNQYLNKFLIQLDLKKAKSIIDNGYSPLERRYVINPTSREALAYLKGLYADGLEGKIVYFDIEIYNEELSCISFATNPQEGISIPFVDWNGNTFSPEVEIEVMKAIALILEDEKIKKCGQNLTFDSHFLLRRYGIRTHNIEDTMIAQNIIMPDYPKGLDFITSVWTDHKYYKDEGKKFFKGSGVFEQLWKYNITDSLMCAEAFPKQQQKLKDAGNWEIYKEQRALIPPLVYMQERGIKVDVEGMKNEATQTLKEIEELEAKLNEVAGMVLNANSSKQLKEYFYVIKKFQPYKSRHTGAVTTDETAMKRLSRKGVEEAQIILDIRRKKKRVSTYLSLDKIDPDGRIRCSFNPAGTRFSRLSSSANIFGTGMNMQNWPHDLHKYLLVDDDYVCYRMDLSQAENRIVAYEGNIPPMMECFESEDDVHSLTAGLILGKNPKEISKEKGSCNLGDGTHSERDWGKKANHSLNYDLGYRAFALIFEMPEKQAAFLVNRYHMAYPGVRGNYHANIRASLRRDRTVTNLLGRRTLFMDQWGDSLFKDAYACIPQGTVGDIMNKRGINFIYYDDLLFPEVELLLQVHDDVTFQIPKYLSWRAHAAILLAIKESLETPLTTSWGHEFVVPVDTTVCRSSLSKEDGVDIKSKKMPSSTSELAKLLQEIVEQD